MSSARTVNKLLNGVCSAVIQLLGFACAVREAWTASHDRDGKCVCVTAGLRDEPDIRQQGTMNGGSMLSCGSRIDVV